MGQFLLLHGGRQGGWAWRRVRDGLVTSGHDAVAPDLPGRDGARTTLTDLYVGAEEALLALGGPAVVVAHSMGGLTATLLAARRPDLVRGAVFVAAVVPAPGSQPLRDAYGPVGGSLMGLLAREGGGRNGTGRRAAALLFGHRLDRSVRRELVRQVNHENTSSITDPYPDYDLGDVPCLYVLTAFDRLLPRRSQLRYAVRLGGRTVVVPTGHSIAAEAPHRLVAVLAEFERSTARPSGVG